MNVNPVPASKDLISEPASQPAPARCAPPPDLPREKERQPKLDNQQIAALVKDMADRIGFMNISLNFSTYGKNNERVAVTVTDKETGKVIREIPPKELQNLYLKMNELIGMIFNHTA
ncbi:MAG TPA: flagellar protein FlaG [Syntrophales bacterium]|nr:flagellar protein FlaG [Syntrophales bacterium]